MGRPSPVLVHHSRQLSSGMSDKLQSEHLFRNSRAELQWRMEPTRVGTFLALFTPAVEVPATVATRSYGASLCLPGSADQNIAGCARSEQFGLFPQALCFFGQTFFKGVGLCETATLHDTPRGFCGSYTAGFERVPILICRSPAFSSKVNTSQVGHCFFQQANTRTTYRNVFRTFRDFSCSPNGTQKRLPSGTVSLLVRRYSASGPQTRPGAKSPKG